MSDGADTHGTQWNPDGSLTICCPKWDGLWGVEHQNEVDPVFCPGCGADIRTSIPAADKVVP